MEYTKDDFDEPDKEVLLDDRVEGRVGKYVGKKEATGTDHEFDEVYEIFYKPPVEGRLNAFTGWIKNLFGDETSKIVKHPKKIPDCALIEDQPVAADGAGAPDSRTVLRHDINENAVYADSISESVDSRLASAKKAKNRAAQDAAEADFNKREAENERDQEKDKSNTRHGVPDEFRMG